MVLGRLEIRVDNNERPLSSVVEHFHGKEGVVGSIPTEGSPGGVAQVVRAHGS